MESLVSPDYSLKEFCDVMHGKNPLEVMDAASAEITSARRLHREATNRSDFRKGSKGREYCDSLWDKRVRMEPPTKDTSTRLRLIGLTSRARTAARDLSGVR